MTPPLLSSRIICACALAISLTACAGATQRHAATPQELTSRQAWEKDTGLSPADGDERGSMDGFDARLSAYAYPFPTQTFRIKAQGIPLEMVYMDVQPAEGLASQGTVVLLHGKNFSGAYWMRTVELLTARGYRVIVPDQVGFGKSSKPTAFQYSFHQLAQLTHALIKDVQGETPVHLVGHSMGGMLATRLALMYPTATRSMTLVNPIGLEDWQRKVAYMSIDDWRASERKRDAESIRAYMTRAYFDGTWKPDYEPLVEIQVGWAEGPDRALIGEISALTYDMIFTQPVLYELPDVKVPTLLIIGQRDRTALGRASAPDDVAATLGLYPELGRQTAAAIPSSTLVELDGIGHVPHYEDFERFSEALTSYLAMH